MPSVFQIVGEALEAKYRGAGYALAAVTGGQLVDFRYLRDVLPDFEGDGSEGSVSLVRHAINDPRIAPAVRELSALGEVHVGMCSCYEFVEL